MLKPELAHHYRCSKCHILPKYSESGSVCSRS
jgi:hypothetical protein